MKKSVSDLLEYGWTIYPMNVGAWAGNVACLYFLFIFCAGFELFKLADDPVGGGEELWSRFARQMLFLWLRVRVSSSLP